MESVATEKEEGKKTDISAYLATPRKKRKNFVIFAVGANVDAQLMEKMDLFVKKNYPNLAVSHPRDLKELTRQFTRNISLLIIDDKFDHLESVISTIQMLKIKSKKEVAPVLFLTSDPGKLLAAYSTKLAPYQESDDYCDMRKQNASQVIGRLKIGIDQKNRRRSRRYSVSLPVTMYHLTKDESFKAKIIDLSIHGALINAEKMDCFKVADQIKLSIPASHLIGSSHGEFLRISARVRRVFIGGSTAGVSFEYVTEKQENQLTRILTSIAREDLVK